MKKTLKNIKKVYQYGRKQRICLVLEIIGSLIGIAISIALPILTAKLIVSMTDNIYTQVLWTTIIILITNIIAELKTVLIRKNTQKFTKETTSNLQKVLGSEILRINQQDLDETSSGTFIQRMTSDVNTLSDMFTVGVGHLVGVVSSLGIFIAILFINKKIFLFYLVVSIILTILHLIKTEKYTIKYELNKDMDEKVLGLVGELVRGTRDIKMLNSKDSFMNVLNSNIEEKNNRRIEMRNVDINYNLIIGTIRSIFELVLILLLIYLIEEKELTASLAIALYSYKNNVMINFMDKISLLLEDTNNFNISAKRVFSLLDNKTFKKEKFGKKHLDVIEGNFEFKNVCFGYQKEKLVLNDLSFKVNANETVGFVGKSGVGKTTIFSLLCKMYNIDSGTITIDGIDINELDEESIRGNITIIGQSPYIFNMSIKDNLRLVKSDITDKEMKEACKIACLDDYIESLPNKYDTIIGEGGVTLSGGQKQRLAIARAFVQKTEIILFDEATSALDNETQSQIQKAIDNLKNEYTILIIAHRFSTIINCDRIYFMEDGKVLASGTHQELLNKCSQYKDLYETEIKSDN